MGPFLMRVLFLGLAAAPALNATTVAYSTKKTGRDYCTGTFIKERIMATAGHCLDDLVTGGAKLTDGTKSIAVIAPDDAVKAGKVDNDTDLALVVFPATVKEVPVKIFDGLTKNFKDDEAISIESRNGNRAKTFRETYAGLGGHSVTRKTTYVLSTDKAGLRPGDSGSGGFNKDGDYIGPLRGCNGTQCGLFLLTSFTGLAVLDKAKKAYPELMALAEDKPRPAGGAAIPAASKIERYYCEAPCTITFTRGKPVEETVKWTVYDQATRADAEREVGKVLKEFCEEYCIKVSGTRSCTLGVKSCR